MRKPYGSVIAQIQQHLLWISTDVEDSKCEKASRKDVHDKNEILRD